MNRKKDYRWIILIFIMTLILLLKLFIDNRFYGHDTLFHAGNIMNLSKTISFSNFLGNNIISLSTNPFGYGTWLFYPKLPHLLAAYIYLISKNIYFSMALIYFITTFLSGIFIYYLSKRLFNTLRVAFLTSLMYITFSYHICEIYTRDAFAENFMFFVIPMIFLGLYELKENNYNKFYLLFIIGYVIGMYSHLISMVFCTIFVALFILYYSNNLLKKEKLKALLLSTIIVIGLVCPFLINILEHKLLGDYIVFTPYFSNKYSTMSNVLRLKSYFTHNKKFIYNNILVYLNYSTIVLFIITIIVYLFKRNKNKFKKTRKYLIYSSLFLIMFINSEYMWEHLPNIFSTIQFPWRLMTFLCCVISLYAPLCFYYKPKNKRKKLYYCAYILVVFLIIIEGLNNIYYYGNKEYQVKEITGRAILGWQMEYFPTNIIDKYIDFYSETPLTRKYEFISEDNLVDIEIKNDDFPNLKFEVNNISKLTEIEIPRIYYLGYELHNEKESKVPIFQTKDGFLGTNIKENGIYTLTYEGTIYNKISNLVRVITLIMIIIWGGFTIWNKRKLLS